MLELVVTGIVLAPVIQLAANIATWCFNVGAASQRTTQRSIIRSTRQELAAERTRQWQIQREARQRISEERRAAHQAHYEMLGDLWETVQQMKQGTLAILQQFEEVRAQNRQFLQTLALTPEQRIAIHECNDGLERGIQRLRAYRGPYIRSFLDEISNAQRALRSPPQYITPNLPDNVLPDEFPFAGELLEFDAHELTNYPFVNLDCGQRGRFITPSSRFVPLQAPVPALVQRYDRDEGFWILSAARGALATEIANGEAYRVPRVVSLGEWRGDCRVGWWEHISGERVMFRLEAGGLSQRMRGAPWGTPIRAFTHTSDFFVRHLSAGEVAAREHKYSGWNLSCDAPKAFWDIYEVAAQLSDNLLIREAGMQGDPIDAALVLRLTTGHEFPLELASSNGAIRVLPQSGQRMGVLQENGRSFLVFSVLGTLKRPEKEDAHSATELLSAISESFEEQRELQRLADADSLELKKYRTVLQAEFEVARLRQLAVADFSDWRISDEESRGQFIVIFETNVKVPERCAVRRCGSDEILGWAEQVTKETASLPINILFEHRNQFRDDEFPHKGKLEAVQINHELQTKIDAIEGFLSAGVTETRSVEEQASFSRLRRELLGRFSNDENVSYPLHKQADRSILDEHQERAVGLVAGNAPLVLIQGPPGTGKTHVIAHSINRILSNNPAARIAIASQANPAVYEVISKLQEAFPTLQIYQDLSASAKEKYASLDRGVGLDRHYESFVQNITEAKISSDQHTASIQSWLKEAVLKDVKQTERDIRHILSRRSQIVACTLSRLASISASAPPFDLVLVDEAAKASVPEAMIAANCGRRLALVGDHRQLLPFLDESYYEHSAPTQGDKRELQKLWNDSLFSRLWNQAPERRKAFLTVMRRSRQPIATCISSCFYEDALVPGRDDYSSRISYPISLIWVDSCGTEHVPSGRTTIKNFGEADLVIQALDRITQITTGSITAAVIAFHRGQAELLTTRINRSQGRLKPSVLTVDASQGGQWDVVILSLARTHGSSGFVGNPNRMNVALSRAKDICVIVGDMNYAQRDQTRDSCLVSVSKFIERHPRKGKWICHNHRGEIPVAFGFPPKPRRDR